MTKDKSNDGKYLFTHIYPYSRDKGGYTALFLKSAYVDRIGPPFISDHMGQAAIHLESLANRPEEDSDPIIEEYQKAFKAWQIYSWDLVTQGLMDEKEAPTLPVQPKLASDFIEFSEIRRVRKDSDKLVAIFNVLQPRGPHSSDGRDTKKKTYFKVEMLEIDADWWEKTGHFIPDELEKAIKAAEAYELK